MGYIDMPRAAAAPNFTDTTAASLRDINLEDLGLRTSALRQASSPGHEGCTDSGAGSGRICAPSGRWAQQGSPRSLQALLFEVIPGLDACAHQSEFESLARACGFVRVIHNPIQLCRNCAYVPTCNSRRATRCHGHRTLTTELASRRLYHARYVSRTISQQKICTGPTSSNRTTSTRTHDIMLYDYIKLRQDHRRVLHRQRKSSPRSTSTWSSTVADINPAAAVIFDRRRRDLRSPPTTRPAAAVIFDRRRRLRQDPPPP
jgi:hypothetical protein